MKKTERREAFRLDKPIFSHSLCKGLVVSCKHEKPRNFKEFRGFSYLRLRSYAFPLTACGTIGTGKRAFTLYWLENRSLYRLGGKPILRRNSPLK